MATTKKAAKGKAAAKKPAAKKASKGASTKASSRAKSPAKAPARSAGKAASKMTSKATGKSTKKATTKVSAKSASGSAARSAKAPTKAAKATKAAPKANARAAKAAAAEPKRKLGLRGAAPWAARHAAKHAAEARARAAEPPLPGSARATIRTPAAAENIKARIGQLHNLSTQVKALRKNMAKGFFDIGIILRDIRDDKLYEAKGFGTFEAYLEREMADIGKTTCLRLVRLCGLFQKEGAIELGMDRVFMALMSIEAGDGIGPDRPSGKIPPPPISSSVLPLKPPGR